MSDTVTTSGKPLSTNERLVREAIDDGAKSWTQVAEYVSERLPAGATFSRQAARQTGDRRGWDLTAKDAPRDLVISFRTRADSMAALDSLVEGLAGTEEKPGLYDVDRSDLIREFIAWGYQSMIDGKRQLPAKYRRKK